jgi:hypothetical protein
VGQFNENEWGSHEGQAVADLAPSNKNKQKPIEKGFIRARTLSISDMIGRASMWNEEVDLAVGSQQGETAGLRNGSTCGQLCRLDRSKVKADVGRRWVRNECLGITTRVPSTEYGVLRTAEARLRGSVEAGSVGRRR